MNKNGMPSIRGTETMINSDTLKLKSFLALPEKYSLIFYIIIYCENKEIQQNPK